jgi:hypothetical protein
VDFWELEILELGLFWDARIWGKDWGRGRAWRPRLGTCGRDGATLIDFARAWLQYLMPFILYVLVRINVRFSIAR